MPDYRHARDIPDVVFLQAIETARRARGHSTATRWDVARALGGLPIDGDPTEPPGVPWKVVLAKFRRMKHRGLAEGCDCSCRGDFYLTPKGLQALTDGLITQTYASIRENLTGGNQ